MREREREREGEEGRLGRTRREELGRRKGSFSHKEMIFGEGSSAGSKRKDGGKEIGELLQSFFCIGDRDIAAHPCGKCRN